MTENISQELAARMAVLERVVASASFGGGIGTEARALVAPLPSPVDPDLIEARQIIAEYYRSARYPQPHLEMAALSGRGDDWFQTKCALAGIKRGRELSRAQSGEQG